MPDIRTVGWVRIEGCQVADLRRQYGTLNGIPNNEQHVYYGTPEIQLSNPFSTTHSVVYCKRSIKEDFEYNNINELNNDWDRFINKIQARLNTETINTSDSDTDIYVKNPFALEESTVIFYDDSSKSNVPGSKYTHYAIVLIDEMAIPQVIEITAKYKGNDVPIGDPVDKNNVEVVAIYDDGNETKIADDAWQLDPEEGIVTNLGANVFTAVFFDAETEANYAKFIVQGCRKLVGITGYYDGGMVAYGKEANKKFFVIIATYSDDTQSTVTDFSFPDTNIVTEENEGHITVFYQGFTCVVDVTPYTVTQSRLIAHYIGPKVEVGKDYLTSDVKVKIYYASSDNEHSTYEEIDDIEECTFSSTTILQEGVNTFNVSYNGQLGTIITSFTVIGFVPDKVPINMSVTYDGPNIYQGRTIDLNRIICNVYYSDNTYKTINASNLVVEPNMIHLIGPNTITITYKEDNTTLSVDIIIEGLENDSTTTNNIFPTQLKNNYPKATILNNRYRGPAEGIKTNDYANMIIRNVNELYKIFADIERQYNKIVLDVSGDTSNKICTLNDTTYMNHQITLLMNDDHYETGKYKAEDKV